jgi:hypothetical protein
MWPVFVVGMCGAFAIAVNWRRRAPAERLLLLWLLIGLAELVVHDSGNERRYVMFVPVVIALATIALAPRGTSDVASAASRGSVERVAGTVLLAALVYMVAGSGMRILLSERVTAGDLSLAVRASTAVALLGASIVAWKWNATIGRLANVRLAAGMMPALTILGIAWNLPDYADWIAHRQTLNYQASLEVGRRLPPGTLVQGKLANGLALDNRIRPLFVGNGFGNYADRFVRDDAGYILTYDLPRIGFESSDGSELIQQILNRYPSRRVVATFQVDETPDPDRAVLIEKAPGR